MIKAWNHLVAGLFIIFVAFLALHSFYYVTEMNFRTYEEEPFLIFNNPIVIMIGVVVVMAIFRGFVYVYKRIAGMKTLFYIIVTLVVLAHVIISLIWIIKNSAIPAGDQFQVWEAAKGIAAGDVSGQRDYLTVYPYQSGMIYPMALVIRLSGCADPIAWRVVNVVALVFLDIGVIAVTGRLFTDAKKLASSIVAIILLIFVPLPIYTTFVYGTLSSIAMAVWAIYGTIMLLQTGKIKWGLLPIVLLPVGYGLYGETAVAVIAIVLAIIAEVINQKKPKLLIIALLLIVCFLLYGKSIRHRLFLDTGIAESEKGSPVVSWIYMGMTSEDGVAGPGSYNDDSLRLYKEHGNDTSAYVIQEDIRILKEYMTGQRDIRFFHEKTLYQWLDPYFNALTMTCNSDSLMSFTEEFRAFLHGNVPKAFYKYILRYFLTFIYIMALIGGIRAFKKENRSDILILLLLFVGGFTLHLVWETKQRYCMPYFIYLFPIATYGLINLTEVKTSMLSLRNKKLLLIPPAQILIVVAITGFQLTGEPFTYEVNEFYSGKNGEPLVYIDCSNDDDNKSIYTDAVLLDKGIYHIDFFYSSDLHDDQVYGGKVYLQSKAGDTIFYTKPRYSYLDDSGRTGFDIMIPHDGCNIQVMVCLDKYNSVYVPPGETGYILADHVEIEKNINSMAKYQFCCWLLLMALIDVLIMLIRVMGNMKL